MDTGAFAPSERPAAERVYRAGHGKRVLLAAALLLLAPFYVSLGPMMVQRIGHGLVGDAAGLAVFGAFFTALMALIGGQLVHSVRSRVELGATSVSWTLPRIVRGLPVPAFAHRDIRYDQIRSVETRSEVYGGRLAPTVLKSTRLTTRDGETIVLGLVNEYNVDQAFPFPQIGSEIAARAGILSVDRGMVHRSLPRRLLGLATAAGDIKPLADADIASIRRSHAYIMWVLIGVLAAAVVAGIAVDAANAGLPGLVGIS